MRPDAIACWRNEVSREKLAGEVEGYCPENMIEGSSRAVESDERERKEERKKGSSISTLSLLDFSDHLITDLENSR